MKIYKRTRQEVCDMLGDQIAFVEKYIEVNNESEYFKGCLTAYYIVLDWLTEKEGR